MNIHPLFVHLPIGILALYSAFEILRFRFLVNRSSYFEVKTILVIAGALSTFLASATGDMAEDVMRKTDPSKLPLVEIHSMFAGAVVGIFSALAVAYFFEWCSRNAVFGFMTRVAILQRISKLILKLSLPLALLGLIFMTITGGLGGAIVYGSDADPFIKVIYTLFSAQ